MRILVIGNAGSVWIKNYIKFIIADGINEVDLFDTGNAEEKDREEYHLSKVKIISFPDNIRTLRCKKSKSIVEKFSNFYLCSLYFRKIGTNYDVINMQYVEASYFRQLCFVKDIREKLILSFWGSDLLRLSNRDIQDMRRLLNIVGCKFVTFDNMDLHDAFKKYFTRCKIPRKVVMLPLPLLDEMDDMGLDYQVLGVNLPQDKIVIAIGYNGGKAQQHIKAIEALGRIKHFYKDRILIVLQMSYGGDDEYVSLCRKKCMDSGIRFHIIADYIAEKDVATLRKISDIFLNAQMTDAFSGSFCEYLYTGTLVLNARWLHYREIDMFSISCIEFDDFDELPDIIEKYIENPDNYHVDVDTNKNAVRMLRSVESCKKQWKQLFLQPIERGDN